MDDVIRIGFVSSRSPETGMVQVTYPDRDRMVTDDLPVLCIGGEYVVPQVNDAVLVTHLSNDLSSGVVIGTYWNQEDVPESGMDWYKKIGNMSFRLSGNNLEISAPSIILKDGARSIAISELLDLKRRVEELEKRE